MAATLRYRQRKPEVECMDVLVLLSGGIDKGLAAPAVGDCVIERYLGGTYGP
jgi:hypothetical protein